MPISHLMFESFTNRLTEHGKTKENSNSGERPICRSDALRRLSSRKAQEKQKYQTLFYICKYIHSYLNLCTSMLSKFDSMICVSHFNYHAAWNSKLKPAVPIAHLRKWHCVEVRTSPKPFASAPKNPSCSEVC